MAKRKNSRLTTARSRPPIKIAAELISPQAGAGVPTPDAIRAMFKPAKTLGFRGLPDIETAQDAALDNAGVYNLLHHTLCNGGLPFADQFLGYGVLSNLTQDGLIRSGVEMRADEMTRKWIELTYSGKDKRAEMERELNDEGGNVSGFPTASPSLTLQAQHDNVISELNGEIERLGLRRLFREAAAMSGYFGGCLAYIDVGDLTDDDLKTPLRLDKDTFAQGSLRGFRLIEPFNVAPGLYNASSPISASYFKPNTWLVMGKEIHASRFLYFAEGRPPTLLLPSYNFFGIPLSQIVLDVVTHFTECREAAARLLTKFSLTVLKTDMQAIFAGQMDGNLDRRLQYFVQKRDNDGVMVIDYANEDIIKLETPLSGVTDIVRQNMEMVAAMFGEPVVKLWGISPGGFNSTGDADMQNHYDHINSVQEKIFRDPLKHALDVLQLNKFGAIDDSLTFSFAPLGSDDDKLMADTQLAKANTAAIFIDRGVVSPAEARKALSEDPKSQFTNIDPDAEVPEPDLALPFEPTPMPEQTEPAAEPGARRDDRDFAGQVY